MNDNDDDDNDDDIHEFSSVAALLYTRTNSHAHKTAYNTQLLDHNTNLQRKLINY